MTLTSTVPIGCLVGSILCGWLLPLGRRRSLIQGDILSIIGALIQVLGSEILLYIGRFLVGVGMGIHGTSTMVYLKECSPVNLLARGGMVGQFLFAFGTLMPSMLGLYLPAIGSGERPNWWKIMFLGVMLGMVIRLLGLLFVFNFKTPKFLLLQKDEDGCKKALKRIYKEKYVQIKLQEIQEDI